MPRATRALLCISCFIVVTLKWNLDWNSIDMMFYMRKWLFAGSFILALFTFGYGQKIQWMSFEEAVSAQQKEKRKLVVDVYTKWCGWCKKMDESTFSNPYIANYINEHYYPVRFDAEQSDPISFQGKNYEYVRNGKRGYHELAVELTMGRLSFPTVVFLDENLSVIQALRGFQSSLRFEQIMTYFAQDYYKDTPWSRYSENYHTVRSQN